MESLYTKYRPQTFADVVGQTHVVTTLERAVMEGRTSHAYLFCGPRGTGKTTMARLLAKALMCEQGEGHLPDGTCEQCRMIAAGEHPDVYELDAASRTGVDNVRDEIISRVSFAPVRGAHKMYIIDEVHMLTTAAFNALLKTLEEPPAHVVFVLCTTDPQKIPETILSRVQRFDFHPIGNADIQARLAHICEREGFGYDPEALELVVRHARGGMRDAISELEQLSVSGGGKITVDVARDVLGEVSASTLERMSMGLAQRDVPLLFAQVESLVEVGRDLLQFTNALAGRLRDVYVVAAIGASSGTVQAADDELPAISREAKAFGSVDRVGRALGLLSDAATEMRVAPNQRLVLEVALTKIARPQSELTLEALADRVSALERQVAALSVPSARRDAQSAESGAARAGAGARPRRQTADEGSARVQAGAAAAGDGGATQTSASAALVEESAPADESDSAYHAQQAAMRGGGETARSASVPASQGVTGQPYDTAHQQGLPASQAAPGQTAWGSSTQGVGQPSATQAAYQQGLPASQAAPGQLAWGSASQVVGQPAGTRAAHKQGVPASQAAAGQPAWGPAAKSAREPAEAQAPYQQGAPSSQTTPGQTAWGSAAQGTSQPASTQVGSQATLHTSAPQAQAAVASQSQPVAGQQINQPAVAQQTTQPQSGASHHQSAAAPQAVQSQPAAAASAPIVDQGELQRRWKQVVDGLLASHPQHGSLLLNSTLVSDDGHELTVSFPKGSMFACRMLERPDVRANVDPMVERVFGQRKARFREGAPSSVQTRAAQTSGGAASASGASAAAGAQSSYQQKQTPASTVTQPTNPQSQAPANPPYQQNQAAAPTAAQNAANSSAQPTNPQGQIAAGASAAQPAYQQAQSAASAGAQQPYQQNQAAAPTAAQPTAATGAAPVTASANPPAGPGAPSAPQTNYPAPWEPQVLADDAVPYDDFDTSPYEEDYAFGLVDEGIRPHVQQAAPGGAASAAPYAAAGQPASNWQSAPSAVFGSQAASASRADQAAQGSAAGVSGDAFTAQAPAFAHDSAQQPSAASSSASAAASMTAPSGQASAAPFSQQPAQQPASAAAATTAPAQQSPTQQPAPAASQQSPMQQAAPAAAAPQSPTQQPAPAASQQSSTQQAASAVAAQAPFSQQQPTQQPVSVFSTQQSPTQQAAPSAAAPQSPMQQAAPSAPTPAQPKPRRARKAAGIPADIVSMMTAVFGEGVTYTAEPPADEEESDATTAPEATDTESEFVEEPVDDADYEDED